MFGRGYICLIDIVLNARQNFRKLFKIRNDTVLKECHHALYGDFCLPRCVLSPLNLTIKFFEIYFYDYIQNNKHIRIIQLITKP